MITDRDYLIHHGIKGMKWGVRKARERKPWSPAKRGFAKRTLKRAVGTGLGVAAVQTVGGLAASAAFLAGHDYATAGIVSMANLSTVALIGSGIYKTGKDYADTKYNSGSYYDRSSGNWMNKPL